LRTGKFQTLGNDGLIKEQIKVKEVRRMLATIHCGIFVLSSPIRKRKYYNTKKNGNAAYCFEWVKTWSRALVEEFRLKLLSASWSNTKHILMQSSYTATRFGGGHHHRPDLSNGNNSREKIHN
jgi:hypothetical protein